MSVDSYPASLGAEFVASFPSFQNITYPNSKQIPIVSGRHVFDFFNLSSKANEKKTPQ